jgi:four helix bundle protein
MLNRDGRDEKEAKDDKNVTFFRFEDLRIYHKSLDYNNWLYDVSMLYPDNDKTQLMQRFSHAARNITFYIAEGSARNKSQFIYYLKLAKSSIRECLVCTSMAYKANNLSDTHEDESRNYLMEMTKMIGALISSLQRSANNHNNYGDPNYNGRSRHEDQMPLPDHTPNDMMSDY